MKSLQRNFLTAATVVIAICLVIFLIIKIHSGLSAEPSEEYVVVDYNNAVVIVLTAVTVIFSISAIALAVLGLIGFENLKRSAGNWAANRALLEIKNAFTDDGPAMKGVKQHIESHEFRSWMENQIQKNVYYFLPIVADRIQSRDYLDLDADAPTDEGDVD